MPPYGWQVVDKTDELKQAGLSLDSTGALSGTPGAGNFNFTVRVTDSAGQMTEKPLTLNIKEASTPGPAVDAAAGGIPSQTADPPRSPSHTATLSVIALAGSETDAKQKVLTFTFNEGTLTLPGQDTMARAALRTVRYFINEFRGESWKGFILSRNHLLETFLCTGFAIFLLLATAMVWKADTSSILAASVFYLVGATAGLGARLRRESQADTAVEDYGLSTARLLIIPLFSGLGAIGGVLLVAMLPFFSAGFGPTGGAPAASPLAISVTSPLNAGEVAAYYDEQLQAGGGSPPYKWTVSAGTLPDGLVLADSGLLSGTPTNEGTGDFAVKVSDDPGNVIEKRFLLPISKKMQATPLEIRNTSPLPEAIIGRDYSARLQASGGVPPYTWSPQGTLPGGLKLGADGFLTGQPNTAGKTRISAQVTDTSVDKAQNATKSFDLTIRQDDQTVAPSTGKPASERIPPLHAIFNLDKNLIGILIAAIFGLTPGLLFDQLQKQAEKYKADLKGSHASEGTQTT